MPHLKKGLVVMMGSKGFSGDCALCVYIWNLVHRLIAWI
jgi:hypothetical protein